MIILNPMKILNPRMALLGLCAATAASAQVYTAVDAYVRPAWHSDYVVEPVLSVGDKLPRTSNVAETYQMVGIPDGMGGHQIPATNNTALFCSHEFGSTVLSEPLVGGTRIKGAFVSRFVLQNVDRGVLSGDLAFTQTFQDNTPVGPIATETNGMPSFARFCAGYLGGVQTGFDRWIYFANEEGTSFNPLGGQAVAIFDGEAHALSKLGGFAKENTVARPYTPRASYGNRIVMISLEDGPATAPYSGVYMYVGSRIPGAATTVEKNGLVNGQLFYLKSTNPAQNSEVTFNGEGSTVTCQWVLAPNAATQTEAQLKAEMTANNFFQFSRPEDGNFHPRIPDDFYFVTTGEDPAGNSLGRMYKLRLNILDPLGPCKLTLVYDADLTTANSDGPLAPDNIEVDIQGNIFVQEDGTGSSRPVYAARNRHSGIWAFKTTKGAVRQQIIAQTDIGRDNVLAARGTAGSGSAPNVNGFTVAQFGIWETSGIFHQILQVGTRRYWGWFGCVQAHAPTAAPVPNTIEDGQIFWMMK